MTQLSTIGYEGADPADFLATLKMAGIKTIVDVREVPASRRRGFSKSHLSAALERIGVEYVHLRGLGDPKPGREAARRGDYATFRRIFNAHLKSPNAREDLDRLAALANSGGACLLCYERNPEQCHRSIIARMMLGSGKLKVRNLGVRRGIAANGPDHRQRARPHSGEGTATRW